MEMKSHTKTQAQTLLFCRENAAKAAFSWLSLCGWRGGCVYEFYRESLLISLINTHAEVEGKESS